MQNASTVYRRVIRVDLMTRRAASTLKGFSTSIITQNYDGIATYGELANDRR
jgi:hypothetical protein